MRRFLLTFFTGLLAFIACSGMFTLKYHVMSRENYLAYLQNQINKSNRSIHILKAEWSNLTEPKRIRLLMEKQTDLKALNFTQVIEWDDVDERYGRGPQ